MNQYADSDSGVNPMRASESEFCPDGLATLSVVADKRDDKSQDKETAAEPVSEFLRFLIAKWEETRFIYELAAEAGLAKSMPSQIKLRTSDASFYSARKLARPLGYRDLPDLVVAAYAWWNSTDRAIVPASTAEAPVAEAMRVALTYRVTQDQIDRVLKRLPPESYGHMDQLWWLSQFHAERTLDAEQTSQIKGLGREVAAAGRVRTKKQGKIREAAAAKDAVAVQEKSDADARAKARSAARSTRKMG